MSNPSDRDQPLTRGDMDNYIRKAETAAIIAATTIAYEKADPEGKHSMRIGFAVLPFLIVGMTVYSWFSNPQPDDFSAKSLIITVVVLLVGIGLCLPPTQKEWDQHNAKHDR